MKSKQSLKKSLTKMMGKAAFNNDMKVPDELSKCVKALNYLEIQLGYLVQDDKEQSDYADEVIQHAIKILS